MSMKVLNLKKNYGSVIDEIHIEKTNSIGEVSITVETYLNQTKNKNVSSAGISLDKNDIKKIIDFLSK